MASEPVVPFAIGDPGRAGREVRPSFSGPAGSPPDTIVDGADLPSIRMRAASVRGLAHRLDGSPRQDALSTAHTADGEWMLVAVADGVGSAAESHWAASVAADAAVRALGAALADEHNWATIWPSVVERASAAVLERARSDHDDLDLAPADARAFMATTLIIAAVSCRAIQDDIHGAYLASVGDSSASLLDGDLMWRAVSAVKGISEGHAADVFGSTIAALPSEHPKIDQYSVGIRPGEALFLMSDGVGDALEEGRSIVGTTLAKWWQMPPEPIEFAAQVGFARRSFTDDRTVIGVWLTQGTTA